MSKSSTTFMPARGARWLYPGSHRRLGWWVGIGVAVPMALALALGYGAAAGLRGALGMLAALIAQDRFTVWLRRRVGPERATLADALTFCRAAAGMALAGIVASGVRDRPGAAGWIGWMVMVVGATACDWLDGPLARKLGPTRTGGALDIEADSWVTLWSAAAAMAWGGLPWWVLVAPLLRYAHPVLDVLGGGLPTGGGPWWGRVTGAAQMALCFAALAPVQSAARDAVVVIATTPVAAAQCAAMLVMLWQRRAAPPLRARKLNAPGG
ncbi:MAG TPA: CDP-alcohol phosphatidyltransferase family protein [Ktedonobacterales bacterium]|nr:CDP-alcohol phosphatidyltransferase family protein [Ktedonobacterales bacterium]